MSFYACNFLLALSCATLGTMARYEYFIENVQEMKNLISQIDSSKQSLALFHCCFNFVIFYKVIIYFFLSSSGHCHGSHGKLVMHF